MTEELGWLELVAEVAVIEEMQPGVEVGFPANQGYEIRPPGYRASVLERAEVNEFGAPKLNIPRRAFLRHTFDKSEKRWVKVLDAAASTMPQAGGGPPMAQALARVAEDAVNSTKASIRDWSKPANRPRTVAQKGFNDPLWETGGMEHAVMAEFTYDQQPPRQEPQGLKEPRTSARKPTKLVHRGRGSKSLLGALLRSGGRWSAIGREAAFRAPGKSASKKATRTRFVPKMKYRRPRV